MMKRFKVIDTDGNAHIIDADLVARGINHALDIVFMKQDDLGVFIGTKTFNNPIGVVEVDDLSSGWNDISKKPNAFTVVLLFDGLKAFIGWWNNRVWKYFSYRDENAKMITREVTHWKEIGPYPDSE